MTWIWRVFRPIGSRYQTRIAAGLLPARQDFDPTPAGLLTTAPDESGHCVCKIQHSFVGKANDNGARFRDTDF